MKIKKMKLIKNIILKSLTYAFMTFCLLMLVLCIFSKKDSDGAVSILGYQTRNRYPITGINPWNIPK